MMTDEMLRAAAQEISQCMTDGISAEPHSFSPDFRRKINRLTRRAKHPLLYRVTRSAAAAMLTLVVTFGSLVALSPAVRAAVIGWVRSTIDNFFQYSTDETTPPDMLYEYAMPEVFHGYTLWLTVDGNHGVTYVYTSDDGKMLQFCYMCGADAGSLLLNMAGCAYERGNVGPFPADIYISADSARSSAVVWQAPDSRILCFLSVIADRQTLLEMAQEAEGFKQPIGTRG